MFLHMFISFTLLMPQNRPNHWS